MTTSKYKFFVTALIVLTQSCTNTKANELQGEWAFNCSEATILRASDKEMAIMTIMQNQIYIQVAIRSPNKNKYSLFFMNTDDIGMGGANLDWDSTSKTNEIGNLTMISNSEAKLNWRGFYNNTSKSYFLTNSPLLDAAKQKNLIKCE